MATKIDNLVIEDHYNKNQRWYSLFWSKNALHFGFWEKGTKNISEAVLNADKFISECLEINESDTVLDAGCGVGGTTIYIAENYSAKVTGITLSETQLKIAKKSSLKSKATDLISFSMQDFTKTEFKDNTFSKIFGIESICHAHSKIDFLNEAFRILKKGGKIAITDAFLIRTNFNVKERKIYEKFMNRWAVPNLSTKDGFYKDLKKAGFNNIKFYDKSEAVRKSSKRIYRLGIVFYPITLLLSKLKIIPKSTHKHAINCINQRKLDDNNMVTYGVFVAEK